MSSESESDQQVMGSGSEEEQFDNSNIEEVESEVENEDSEAEEDSEVEEKQKEPGLDVDSDNVVEEKDKMPLADQEYKISLFLRFPCDILDYEALNKDLEKTLKEHCSRITKVHVPRRQKCVAYFDSLEDKAESIKELNQIMINGRSLLKERESRFKQYSSSLFVRNIPAKSTKSQIRRLFPTATNVFVHFAKNSESTLTATVNFRTSKESARVRYGRKLKIGANELMIYFNKKPWVNSLLKQEIGQYYNKNPFSNGGKRKLNVHSDSGTSSPPKKQMNINKKNEDENPMDFHEKTENGLEKIKIKKDKKMENIKTTSKENGKRIKSSKKGNKSLVTTDNKPIVQRK